MTTHSSCTAAFFDIRNTLAAVRLSASGDRIIEFTAYPGILALLAGLKDDGVRLGVISSHPALYGTELHLELDRMGILSLFDESLILVASKLSPRCFREAASLVLPAEARGETTLLYVSEDADERARAREAGFRTAPHPSLARALLRRDAALRYLRLHLRHDREIWRTTLSRCSVAPLYVSPARPNGTGFLYAIADEASIRVLEDLGFTVDLLGPAHAPQTSTAYFVRTAQPAHNRFHAAARPQLAGCSSESAAPLLLDVTEEGLFIALPFGAHIANLGWQSERHHDPVKLIPSLMLLENAPIPLLLPRLGDPSEPLLLRVEEVEVLKRCITADALAQDVARYAGTEKGSQEPPIRSRHIFHSDNARAVDALGDDLTRPGLNLKVTRQPFKNEGRDLENVIAILPPAADRVREGIVVVGAHLDSTATEQSCYRPCIDPAPGADDDASGIAGVLAAARACVQLASLGISHREIRFVLFNSEEIGIAGSGEYAAECVAKGDVIVAMFQMDMIGHDLVHPRHFELHAGLVPPWPDDGAALQDASRSLADLIVRLRPEVAGDLDEPEVFADLNDPAVEHSDHSRFHAAGYPACLASEDFFPGQGTAGDRNPNYHAPTDTKVNATYAADIARVVAAAAWVMATR